MNDFERLLLYLAALAGVLYLHERFVKRAAPAAEAEEVASAAPRPNSSGEFNTLEDVKKYYEGGS